MFGNFWASYVNCEKVAIDHGDLVEFIILQGLPMPNDSNKDTELRACSHQA